MKFYNVKSGEWVQPTPRGYLFKCCDCNLVHKMNFKVIKYAGGKRAKVQFQAFRVGKNKITDRQRIQWLGTQFGCALINDDNGHWTVSHDGMQSVAYGKKPMDVQTTFFVKAKQWTPSVRMAIDAAIRQQEAR